ncbi:hypothetical protein ACHAXR_008768 [Thalassiosira sp. AJA248-18]
MITPTGQCCDVYGFHYSFNAIKDVPIARAATAITDENGVTYILVVNEALSLVNPNQIRHYGTPVCDDPYDPHRKLGIEHHEMIIPFETRGSAVYFETRVSSDDEMDTCKLITLTDGEIEWDPQQVDMNGDRPYGDYNTARINEVRIENDRRREIAVEHETDLCLVGLISSSLMPDMLYERLLASVKVEYNPNQRIKIEHPKSTKLRETECNASDLGDLAKYKLISNIWSSHQSTSRGL